MIWKGARIINHDISETLMSGSLPTLFIYIRDKLHSAETGSAPESALDARALYPAIYKRNWLYARPKRTGSEKAGYEITGFRNSLVPK